MKTDIALSAGLKPLQSAIAAPAAASPRPDQGLGQSVPLRRWRRSRPGGRPLPMAVLLPRQPIFRWRDSRLRAGGIGGALPAGKADCRELAARLGARAAPRGRVADSSHVTHPGCARLSQKSRRSLSRRCWRAPRCAANAIYRGSAMTTGFHDVRFRCGYRWDKRRTGAAH